MSDRMKVYRQLHPEYYEMEKVKNNIRAKLYYATNEEKRELNKKRAIERYYRLKAEKENNQSVQVS